MTASEAGFETVGAAATTGGGTDKTTGAAAVTDSVMLCEVAVVPCWPRLVRSMWVASCTVYRTNSDPAVPMRASPFTGQWAVEATGATILAAAEIPAVSVV